MTFSFFSINLTFAFILGFIFILIIPMIIHLFKKNRLLAIIYFILYLIILALGVFLDVKISDSRVYLGLTITNSWFNNSFSLAYFNFETIIINLLLLFPLGYIIPLISKRRNCLIRVIILGLLTSITIEILQFSLPIIRYPELLDIINNVISVILGYIYYLLLDSIDRKCKHDKLPKQKNSY